MAKREFKVFDESLLSNRDFHLTNLNKSDGKNYSLYTLLADYLAMYGIYFRGGTTICDSYKNHTNIKVNGCTLDKDIPVENIGIIKQMYGYDLALVNICLDNNDSREFAFWFNIDDESCELEKLIFGSVKWSKKYKNFEEMMKDVRQYDIIDGIIHGVPKIEPFYITFGQHHSHTHGSIILDKDCVGVIKAESYERMREIAFELFNGEFATTYTKEQILPLMHFFPRGTIELN